MRRLILGGVTVVLALIFAAPAVANQSQTRPEIEARQQRRQELRARAVERRLHRLDRDASGAISRQEWPRRPEAFDRLDTNKDGQLSPSELGRRRVRPHRRII
jgi:Ca2+-binding EF-hand superfamily protein